MVEWGFVVGSAGLVLSVVSLVYARLQAGAAVRQAEQARHQVEESRRIVHLESEFAMFQRLRETTRRFREIPPVYREWRRTHRHLARDYDRAGGPDAFLFLREVINTFQEIYFLRRAGAVNDHYWRLWSRARFPLYGALPTFQWIFQRTVEREYLEPDFVAFMKEVLAGRPVADPRGSDAGQADEETGFLARPR